MKTMEQKPEPEPVAAGYRPSPRPPDWRWDSPPRPSWPAQLPHPSALDPYGPPTTPTPLTQSHGHARPIQGAPAPLQQEVRH